MGSLMRKGLISVVAAGLLSSAAFSATNGEVDHTDAADFRLVPNTNSVVKDKSVIIGIDLLKADGSLDNVESLYGNTVQVKCVSTLGTCPATTNMTNGHAFVQVDESTIGTDQVSISVVITDAEGDAKILPAKSIEITVAKPDNKAKGLEIIEYQSIKDSAHKYTYDGNYSKTPDSNLSAGEGFTVKIEAIQSEDNEANDASEPLQNSTVTLRIIDSDKEVVKTLTAPMSSGVAYVTVPNETLTKADCFYLQALTPTDNTDAPMLNGERTALSEKYKVCFNPLEAAKLSLDANVSNIYRLEDDNQTKASITVCLADKYGNKTKNESGDAIEVSLGVNDKDAFDIDNTTLSIADGSQCAANTTTLSIKDRDKLSDTSAKVATVTASADNLSDGSVDVNAYKHRLYTSVGTAIAAAPFLDVSNVILGTSFSAEANETKAGQAFRVVNKDDNKSLKVFGQSKGDDDLSLIGKNVKVTFYQGSAAGESVTTSVEQGADANDDRNQSIALKLNKKAEYDSFVIEYLGSDKAYAPVTVKFPSDKNMSVEPADPEKIEVYAGTLDGKYVKVEKTDLDKVSAITVDLNQNETVAFDANESNVTTSGLNNLYLVALEDTFGNAITQGQVSITAPKANSNTTQNLKLNGSNVVDFNYSKLKSDVPTTDTITISAALVDAKEINVDIVDNKPVLKKIEPSFVKNAVIRGSYIPFSVTAYDQFDKKMDDEIIQVVISDTTKVKIYEYGTTNEIVSGGDINTSKTYVVKGVNLGSATLTFRNVAGTIAQDQEVVVVSNIEQEESSDNTVTGTLNIVQGKWNLVTTPVPANMPKSELDAYTSKTVWAFDSNAYNYVAAGSELEVGKGYWVKADKQGGTLTYSAVPTVADKDAQWTLISNNLVAGTWNLIGTSFDTTKTEVKSALGVNSVWPYDPAANQYSTAENIGAGAGMWVK